LRIEDVIDCKVQNKKIKIGLKFSIKPSKFPLGQNTSKKYYRIQALKPRSKKCKKYY